MPPKKKIEKPTPKKSDAETILDKHFERKETPKKKITKKEETKIVKQVKETEAKKEEKKEEILLPPKVVHELRRTEKFDLNWFYLKKRFVAFEKWLSAPYTKEFWRKHGFIEKSKEVKKFDENVKIVNEQSLVINPQFPKSISSVGDFNKPLTAEELAKIKRIRELILSDDFDKNIFRSDK